MTFDIGQFCLRQNTVTGWMAEFCRKFWDFGRGVGLPCATHQDNCPRRARCRGFLALLASAVLGPVLACALTRFVEISFAAVTHFSLLLNKEGTDKLSYRVIWSKEERLGVCVLRR